MLHSGAYNILADTDLITMVVTMLSVLRRAPRLLQQRPPIPAEYKIEEVPSANLSDKQKTFFDAFDSKLTALNYFPVCTYRIANLERTLIRKYANPMDPASCEVAALEVRYRYKDEIRWAPASVVSFRTDFTDGRSLITKNAKRRTLFDTLPEFIVQQCPTVEDPVAMKRMHDRKAAGMGCPQPRSNDVTTIFKQIQVDHHRFSQYQLERGLYARHPEGYVLTSKTHWRAIRNHYNPFVQHVSGLRMALSALFAIGIPSLTHGYFSSALMVADPAAVMGVALLGQVTMLVSYLVAGTAIGLLIQRNSFLWAFLLTYLGVHLCTGWWASPIPYCTIASLTSFWVTRLQHKQKLMLGDREPKSVLQSPA